MNEANDLLNTFLSFSFEHWALQTVTMMITAFLLPKLTVSGPVGAFFAVAVLSFVNMKLWDVALFLQIPTSFTQTAVLLLLANAAIFWVVVKLTPGIEISGILPAILAPIVFSVTNVLIATYGKDIEWSKWFAMAADYVVSMRDFFRSNGKVTP